MISADPYSPEWLNNLSDEGKKAVAAGEFIHHMQNYGGAHVAWIYWRAIHRLLRVPRIEHNASGFVLDCGRGSFLVTAGHVLEGFLRHKRAARSIKSQIGNLAIDLEERLIDCGTDARIDIATFHLQSEEIAAIGKQVIAGGENWPPPPASGEVVFFGGFPGSQRLALGPKEVSFGLHCAMTPVSDFTVHQIRCRLDRCHWVDTHGLGLPLPGYDTGGLSGGPMLAPSYINGRWSWRLVGVICESLMHKEYEVITATRAHFILPDGRISR